MPSTISEPPSPGPSTSNSNSNYQNQTVEPIGITPQIAPDIITLPTVLITYKHPLTSQPRSVKARIDRNVPLDEVVRQLCTSAQLAINEPAHQFSLRDASNNELITNENVYRKVSNGCMALKLVPSPALEAKEMAERLSNNSVDEKTIKLSLFSLKDYLREADFTAEFEARGGSLALAKLCETTSAGNTLAYALSALQVLAEQDRANDLFTTSGLHRFAHLLSTSALVNVLRPTTAVIRRLVSAENGFETVWPVLESTLTNEEEQGTEEILCVLAKRIAGATNADFSLAQVTLGLVNELIRGSLLTSDRDLFINFEEALERAGIAKSVIRLQEGGAGESDGLVLGYQTLSGQLFTKLREMVVSSEYERDVNKLMEMANRACELDSKPNENQDENEEREARKWKTLGFESENLLDDFENVGSLGLKLMYRFTTVHTPDFDKFILEELSRPEAKRCPFAKASNKCAEILAEIYEWNATEASQAPRLNMATAYQPLMIQLPKLHSHVLKFFRLMWSASGATTHDFTRVGVLVRSHLSNVLRGIAITGSERPGSRPQWAELIRELETVDYVRVRDRQMQELALEDSLLNKPPVRNLRGKLYQDSFEFVKAQRVNSLMQGSWFLHSPIIPNQLNTSNNHNTRNQKNSTTPTLSGGLQQQAKWRFYRLAPNRKYLHYFESHLPTMPVKNGVDEMPDRIEISSITEIISGNGAPELNQSTGMRNLNRRSSTHSTTSTTTDSSPSTPHLSHPLNNHHHQNTIPKLSLMGAGQTLAILVPSSTELHAEWLDGLNLLREDGAMVATKESAQLVFTLTQIGTQIKLLDLSGERVEIPNHLDIPPVPISTDFFYSEGANSNNSNTNHENHQPQQVVDPV
ncbi:ELMO/CED-12 family-domain-containing protein [Melampsora americana]|nr:ELMO/CED-12 family-domain-containing protein [Melampsora americana]